MLGVVWTVGTGVVGCESARPSSMLLLKEQSSSQN